MIDVKAGDKACKRFVLFSILYLMITAFVLDTPAEILAGMKRIVISRDALITDYFVIGGYGAAFFNAALCSLGTLSSLVVVSSKSILVFAC